MREELVRVLGAILAGTHVTQPQSGNAIPSLAFDAAITLISFAAAIVRGSAQSCWHGIGVVALLTIAVGNAKEGQGSSC
ncbi:hypothetical protein [Roseomonas sp. WA12]